MTKRLLSILICVTLLVGMAAPVLAQEEERILKISTPQALLELAESCRLDSYSEGLTVVLEKNIDLTDVDFSAISVFSGTFDGAGHTISGLQITAEGSNQGLFRYLTATAVVRDLQLQVIVQPGGSRAQVGALAGQNAGAVTGCAVQVQVTGSSQVGGLVGINQVTGRIEGCKVEGQISGDHFVGGIAGENLGVIHDCVNHAQVNTTPQENNVELSDITMDTLTNSEAVNAVTDIGGIAGISSGVIRGCENRGAVGYRHMGYNIGGIAGTQSGYLTACENYGHIQGRKEVGGIVGQMEPITVMDYSADSLQILEGQLGTMSQMVNQASADAMTGTAELNQQIAALQDQADTAREAVDALRGDGNSLPDADAALAAYNSLSAALQAMPQTLQSIASTAQGTASGLTDDLAAISGQVSEMGGTVQSASSNLGGTLTDISDEDTPEDLSGKVSACRNYGDVLADTDAGGIAGAMAMENDLDTLQDWQTSGETSLNVDAQVRAVVRECENYGTVSGKKQNAGGIVGWQLLGLIKDCINAGALEGADADYVGGVCGMSTGKIRQSYAKCLITAGTYAGGIAGRAATLTDCIAIVKLQNTTERAGAVLGWLESGQDNHCEGNYYLPVGQDVGAIDGISYEGCAQPLELEAFLQLQTLPDSFRTVHIRFVQEDGTESKLTVPLGGDLDRQQIPQIPEKAGSSGRWEGIESAQLEDVLFDMSFQAVYRAYSATIESEATRQDGRPVLLAEGAFTHQAAVTVAPWEETPDLTAGQKQLESWSVQLTEPARIVRFLLPEEVHTNGLILLVQTPAGVWQETEFTVDGSYAVFASVEGMTGFAIVQNSFPYWAVILGAAVLLAAAGAAAICIRKKK